MKIPESLIKRLNTRVESESFRSLQILEGLTDFSSNDYLGLAKTKNEILSLNGSTGSRLISGNYLEIEKLEDKLSLVHNSEKSLIFNSGYNANLGVLSCIPHRHDLIIYDELCHASIIDGIRLSNSKSIAFKHNSLDDLERILKTAKNSYIVTESVFSMDGDLCPLNEIVKLTKKYNSYLILDEAHGLGVVSRYGLAEKLGLEKDIFLRIYTYGKALGCHGAAVCCSQIVKDFLINFSRPLIYSTSLSPHSVEVINQRYNLLAESEDLIKDLNSKIRLFSESLGNKEFVGGDSAIFAVLVPGNNQVKEFAEYLQGKGFDIRPIRSPTVPKGSERLRICLHTFNSEQEIIDLAQAILSYGH